MTSLHFAKKFRLRMLIAESCKLTSARQPNASTLVAASAFVFKDGEKRSDYEHALPDLMDYYSAIRRIGDVPFHVEESARLELEWWIVHRERQSHDSGDLVTALGELAAEIYQMPAGRFHEHAQYRAEAMTLRDRVSEKGGLTEADWQKIHETFGPVLAFAVACHQ